MRSQEEILQTLDTAGMLDGLPFMPEMLQYCGKRFRVAQVAHKTCDTVHYSGIRRMKSAVHLDGLRCDGSAHGGCQAACLLIWKEQWLRHVDTPQRKHDPPPESAGCTLEALYGAVRQDDSTENDVRYRCQITQLLAATRPWAWWNPMQYVADVITGNWTFGHVVRVLTLAAIRRLIAFNFGVRALIGIYDRLAHRFGMHCYREVEGQSGHVPEGARTPAGDETLEEGAWVRVRSRDEILSTLNKRGRNRGLHFDPEMVKYCGGTYRVRAMVERILDESTGRMVTMKNPCVMLDGVVCKSEYSGKRLMCPRAIPPYWRPVWLQKVERPEQPHALNTGAESGHAHR